MLWVSLVQVEVDDEYLDEFHNLDFDGMVQILFGQVTDQLFHEVRNLLNEDFVNVLEVELFLVLFAL